MATEVGGQTNSASSDFEEGDVSRIPITRDFLDGCFGMKSKNNFFDSEVHPPPGWQKVLDLKTGTKYLRRLNNFPPRRPPVPPVKSSSADYKSNRMSLPSRRNTSTSPTSMSPVSFYKDDLNLNLNLDVSYTSATPTVEKVKLALEKVWMIRDPTALTISSSSSSVKRSVRSCSSSPDLSSTVSSFKNDFAAAAGEDIDNNTKKLKLDLNISL